MVRINFTCEAAGAGEFSEVGVGPEFIGVVFGVWIEGDGVVGALAADRGGDFRTFSTGVVKGDLVPVGADFELIDLRIFDSGEGIQRAGGADPVVVRVGAGNIACDFRGEE